MVKEYTKKKEIQIIMFIKCVQHLKYFFQNSNVTIIK